MVQISAKNSLSPVNTTKEAKENKMVRNRRKPKSQGD